MPLVGVGFCVSIQFGVVEQAKGFFKRVNQGEPLTLTQLFLSGAVAGTANSVFSGPVEHIRTRLQVQVTPAGGKPEFAGPLDCLRKIYARSGLLGVYKGQLPTIAREFFGFGFYFMTYEWAIRHVVAYTGIGLDNLNPLWVILCGAFGGFAMWAPVFPIDSIKSRMQTDGFGKDAKYSGALDCARKVLAKEGVPGLFKGFAPCMLRAAPVNAATFLGFELAMRALGR